MFQDTLTRCQNNIAVSCLWADKFLNQMCTHACKMIHFRCNSQLWWKGYFIIVTKLFPSVSLSRTLFYSRAYLCIDIAKRRRDLSHLIMNTIVCCMYKQAIKKLNHFINNNSLLLQFHSQSMNLNVSTWMRLGFSKS